MSLVQATVQARPHIRAPSFPEYGARLWAPQDPAVPVAGRKTTGTWQKPSLPASPSYILTMTQGADSVPMNAPSELSFEEMLRIRLEVLRREHRDLDQAIHALEETGRPDQLTLRRLKKQKLSLKDQIVKIEDQLIPDIIA
jgi:hypothetical protein